MKGAQTLKNKKQKHKEQQHKGDKQTSTHENKTQSQFALALRCRRGR